MSSERSPLIDMSRTSQEGKTTARSSGSYQRIKNANKGITIEEHEGNPLANEHEIDPTEVRLDIHDDILPTTHDSKEKEDVMSDMDVQEGSLKKITRPNIKDKSSTPQYKKNIWPGQNSVQYFCYKKCKVVAGPDRWLFYTTVLLVIIPGLLFFAFPGSRIWYRWSHVGKALDIFGMYILLSVLFFLFKAGYSDPGIIPRNPNWQQLFEENKWRHIAETYYQRRKRKKRKKKQITMKGITLNINYCDTCHIFRPPRSSHCRICDCCIDSFDHHCPWTGNCVGKLNYRYFLLFVFSVLFGCAYFTTLCLLQLFAKGHPNVFQELEEDYFVDITVNQSPLANQLVILLLVTIMVVGFVMVGYLSFVHCRLMALGQTTYENLKGKWDGGINPFNLGCRMNWLNACCGPLYSSYIDVSWMKKDNK